MLRNYFGGTADRFKIREVAAWHLSLVSRLTNKLHKKDQRRSGGGIGIGLLR
jgi:hypothetical protein